MSDLLSRLNQINQDKAVSSKRAQRCAVGTILVKLEVEDSKQLETALADVRTYSAASISRVLRTLKHTVSESSIRRHRRGDCSCGEADRA